MTPQMAGLAHEAVAEQVLGGRPRKRCAAIAPDETSRRRDRPRQRARLIPMVRPGRHHLGQQQEHQEPQDYRPATALFKAWRPSGYPTDWQSAG